MSAERLRLLAAGNCVSGIKHGNGPYRETAEKLLPRFSLEGNGRTATAATGHEVVAGGLWPPRGSAVEAESKGQTNMKTQIEAGSPGGIEQSEPVARARKENGWLARLARLFGRPASVPPVPRLPPMTRRQVQCELSLDEVKVVRNDLKDSEIEVVPFRSSSAPTEHAPFSLRRASTGGPATFLGRATWRLFGPR